jgi:hypothetical protein
VAAVKVLSGGVGAIPEVDPQHPNASRIHDYFLGGPHNFAADRQAAAAALAAMPEMTEAIRANRDFLRRAVTTVAEAGVDQFLDLGAGIPFADNALEVARRIAPRARVVSVDLEPVAVVHTHRLLAGDPEAGVLWADLTDPDAVLGAEPVRRLIDFTRPVCVLAVAVGDFIPDTERLGRALGRYRDAAAPGSFLVLSHGSAQGDPERAEQVRRIYNSTTSPLVAREHDEVRALAGDWTPIEPGVSNPAGWRPDARTAQVSRVANRSLLVMVAQKSTHPGH